MSTSAHITVSRRVPCPTLAQLTAFLERTGWTLVSRDDVWAYYEAEDDMMQSVEVPLLEHASDFHQRIAEAIGQIAALAPMHVDTADVYEAIMKEAT